MQKPLVIIPTYNERDNIEKMIPAVFEALPEGELLIIDDGSPDGTGDFVEQQISSGQQHLHLMCREGKQGLGTAYLAGFKFALERDYTHVFEMDADFSHNPADLPRLLSATENADLALGSRWISGGGTVGWPLKRKILSRGGSFYARTILGVHIKDLTGGFKCFKRETLQALDFDAISAKGYGFQIELTWRVLKLGMRVVEVPITFTERQVGVSKMSGSIFKEALTLVWKLRLGKV